MHDGIESFLKKHLNTNFVGKQIYYYRSVTSTMAIAKRLAREGADEGTIVIADKQTAGRGRLGRTWLSPESNLAISIILRPPLNTLLTLIMIASVAVVRAIKRVTGIDARIKWPNDVLINGKKVCGILIENEFNDNKPSFSIVGIGININLDPSAFPEITSVITSLSHETGHIVPRTELTCTLLLEMERLYQQARGGTAVYKEWLKNMETVGKLVRVQAGDSVEQGMAEAVTENGNLILRHADGSTSEIVAGDVTLLKDCFSPP